ncbi:MAG: hypothetical protein KDA80_07365 [Planctomycetaceae bacterium]|nr:hypothetical protein [Planctomycetaceae bacterium]
MQLSVSHAFLPKSHTTRASMVMQHFGIDFEQGRHVLAETLSLPIEHGQLVLFTGESGSGKSSLMRETATQLRGAGESVIDVDDLNLGESLLIDRLELNFEESLKLLAACGLGDAHLMLRTPAELSEGQRYRFRLALALSQRPDWLIADEFTATLDRTLAKIVSFNLRKLCDRSKTGFLLATTHDDVTKDLNPDLHVQCHLNGQIDTVIRDEDRKKKTLLLTDGLWLSRGSKTDWPYFARWHYRSHQIAFVRDVILLWHYDQPIGICVFTSPPKSLSQRNKFFGRSGGWNRTAMRMVNRQVTMLSRVVLHPTWRGAGVAHAFVRRCCELSSYPWIETLTEMGHYNPFFERAGFLRIGCSTPRERSRESHSSLYGSRRRHGHQKALLSQETFEKSRFSHPVYYIYDNRENAPLNRLQSRRQECSIDTDDSVGNAQGS